MPLQEQVVPIEFGQGVDTKSDPKAVVAGKMLRLENAVFTAPNRITKRNGYDNMPTVIGGVGNLADPKLVHEYNEELIAADQNLLLTYSPEDQAWLPRGGYVSTQLSRFSIDQEHPADGYTDCAYLGGYTLYAWSTVSRTGFSAPAVSGAVYASVVDNTSGAVLIGPELLSSAQAHVRCVVLANATLAVIYKNAAGTDLVLRTVVMSSPGVVTFSAPITVSTNFDPHEDPVFYPGFDVDVVPTSTGAAIFYGSTTGVTVSLLNSSGSVASTQVIADASAAGPMYISRNATSGDFWLYWCNPSVISAPIVSNDLVYAVYSSTLVSVLGKTVIASLATTNPCYFTNIISRDLSGTQQQVYFGDYDGIVANANDQTRTCTLTTGGAVGAITTFAYGVLPFSRPFGATVNTISNQFAVFLYRGSNLTTNTFLPTSQPTFFLVQLTNTPDTDIPLVVARFASGLANLQATVRQTIGYTPSIQSLGSNEWLFACGVATQNYESDYWSLSGRGPGALAGAFSYTFGFDGQDAYVAVNAGELAVLNGALMQAYDGQSCSEFGFHLFPEISLDAITDADGLMGAGSYSYLVIYQWVDGQGNLHQSAPSLTSTVTVAGPDNAVNVKVTTPFLSQKTNVAVAVYRTKNAGTAYFLVSDPVFLTFADPTAGNTVTFKDILNDASLDGNPNPYTSPASSVLENGATPPSMRMLAHNNRLWFVDEEERNTVWYTKSFSQGVGLSPSPFLTQQLDPKFGQIEALAEMDDKIVYLKDGPGMLVQAGDGANDIGANSSLSFPQIVPSDVGCSEMKSVFLQPMGVMFKSPKGIYLLNRALNVQYIGMEVEQYNSQTITSAKALPGKSQVRFLCSTGNTLVFDYIFNQWATFTNHTGKSATVWGSTYVYARTGANIYQENLSSYSDAGTGFEVLIQTSWLALSGIQGFQRARRLAMLGDYVNGASASHSLQISFAYDFVQTFTSPYVYTFGATSSGAPFQYRERVQQQKCDTVSLLIEENATGDSLEYLDLTNISFEVAVKKGINKLPASKTVA